jgi:hypothetical protein
MHIDISKLSTTELDELIRDLMQRRANLKEPFPNPIEFGAPVFIGCQWTCRTIPEGVVVDFLHPGAGWTSFLIADYLHLMNVFQNIAAAAAPDSAGGIADAHDPANNGRFH